MEHVDSYWIGQIARMQRTFSKEDVRRWSMLTKDCNDVYESGLSNKEIRQPLVPGIVSEGLITDVISNYLPGVPCVIMQKELLFLQPVQVGNTIMAEVEIIDVNIVQSWITEKIRCINERGMEVIRGLIVLKLL